MLPATDSGKRRAKQAEVKGGGKKEMCAAQETESENYYLFISAKLSGSGEPEGNQS